MGCAFCGEGDEWIKTCRMKDGSHIRVCDSCYDVLGSWLVLVPGDRVVIARCERYGSYFNPREMTKASLGGRHYTYSGPCRGCAKAGTGVQADLPDSVA